MALVHGARDGGAGHQVGAVLGKENALADRVHVVAGAADALHAAGHRRRRFDLDDQIDRAHVDAQFQRRRGAQRANLPGLQLLLDHRALRRGQRAVMRARNGLAGQVVQRSGQPLGRLPRVHKQNRRVALANDFKQPRMNRIPDGDAPRRLRGRPGGNLLHLAQPRHVFHRNLDAQLELLGRGGVDDGDGAVAERCTASAELRERGSQGVREPGIGARASSRQDARVFIVDLCAADLAAGARRR